MIEMEILRAEYEVGLSYEDYLSTGTPEQQRRWTAAYDAARLRPEQERLVAAMGRQMHILVVSGIWCGDCVEQCPLIARCAEANPAAIGLRFTDRDSRKEFSERLHLNRGSRVPVAIFMAEDFEFCSMFGDRSLSRYRIVAARQLGPSCPIGAVVPEASQLAATLQDWMNEIERIQLMLRLSARLRQSHGD